MSGSTSNLFSITIISVFKNYGQDNKTANSYGCNVMVNGLKLRATSNLFSITIISVFKNYGRDNIKNCKQLWL